MNHPLAALCVALLAMIFHANADIDIVTKHDDKFTVNAVVFNVRKEFTLRCKISSSDKNFTVEWRKEGKNVKELLKGRCDTKTKGDEYSLTVRETKEDDAGEYKCVAIPVPKTGEEKAGAIHVYSKLYIKSPPSVNVVEEEPLHLKCIAHGQPDSMHWEYSNDTLEKGEELSEDDRYKIEFSNNTLELTIKNSDKSDRGTYSCIAHVDLLDISVKNDIAVRIIDKYAALWPFLGICLEVFFLCAIIFIYEKRRNKTELEESDTDQSPDQKNTPDGKESNLRHRQ